MDSSHIQEVFEAQRKNRWHIAQSTAEQRIEKLQKLRAALISRRHEIVAAMRQDFGKCQAEVALSEIAPITEEIAFVCARLKRWMKPKRVAAHLFTLGSRSEVRYEPKGQVLILAPWNYPVHLFLLPLVGAIAAGNVVMMSASDRTPHTEAVLTKLISETFSANEVAAFMGGVPAAEALMECPFDHVFFTGSPGVGKKIMAKAAQHLATVTLELGGKSPAVLHETCDIPQAAHAIAFGKFLNAGQTCICPNHVWVPRDLAAPFVSAISQRIRDFYGETPEQRRASPDFARVVDARGWQRMKHLLDASLAEGAQAVMGGETDEATRYVAPTVLSGVTPSMTIMQEEIFGPLLPVLVYDSLDEVLAFIQCGGKPLALYAFGHQEAFIQRMLNETSAGGTVINNTLLHIVNSHLPFGGAGQSGQGSYHGHHSFRTFSHERAVVHQGGLIASLVSLPHPPYSKMKAMEKIVLKQKTGLGPD
ncbi:aldehyde dehydrogenase family protein [Prosthecobacter sp.]|uniref:aldehyde dehydrogenase family protein n=1 Tax=Prosthecobacter sp. TaxID=1965333 RepID=UPI003783F500